MAPGLVRIARRRVATEKLGYFRFGALGERVVLTNDAACWHVLSRPDFEAFVSGQLPDTHPDATALLEKGFYRDDGNLTRFAEKVRCKKRFVGEGPHLHIVVPTLRCNQSCRYCHASRADMSRVETDMSMETAKRVVDLVMQSPSPFVNIEFQGGEPVLNFQVLKFIVEYSREKNRQEHKELVYSLVTNFTCMTEEIADWLVDNEVMICTSLDGPPELHNRNRPWDKDHGDAFAEVTRWIRYLNQRYIDKGNDPSLWHVDALMTTTRAAFDAWREIIDLYVELGMRTLTLRPLNPFGFAAGTWKSIGYEVDGYLEFYAKCLDYIIELNRKGIEINEGTAATFLTKMLTPDDPNFVDIRSPCGAGIGQIAYNYDGRIFTCDEGRMLSAMGQDDFEIGEVAGTTLDEAVHHPSVRAIAMASIQDALPGCESCWNKPFCGVCPVHNQMESGTLFGQRPTSAKCKEYYGVASLLLDRLVNDEDGDVLEMFKRWAVRRPRTSVANITSCASGS